MWCIISGEAAGEIWNSSLLGVKDLKLGTLVSFPPHDGRQGKTLKPRLLLLLLLLSCHCCWSCPCYFSWPGVWRYHTKGSALVHHPTRQCSLGSLQLGDNRPQWNARDRGTNRPRFHCQSQPWWPWARHSVQSSCQARERHEWDPIMDRGGHIWHTWWGSRW